MPAPAPAPKSQHTGDPFLAPFLAASFDPTAYLNSHIPPLAFPTPAQPVPPPRHQALPAVAAATQTHIAQVSAHLNRLSDALTALTDDILRSASRLAYAVELLRGDANALSDSLRHGLADHVAEFVPGGLDRAVAQLTASERAADAETDDEAETTNQAAADAAPAPETDEDVPATSEPAALARLRTLHAVRARLHEVTAVFDKALAWPLPPSARPAPSFVGVSAPADADPAAARQLEEQGQEAQRVLRESVTDLLSPGGRSGGAEGVLAAEERIRELREVCLVWRGTAEEKPRTKFVDGLAKMVADRRREEETKGTLKKLGEEEPVSETKAAMQKGSEETKKGGLFSGFRRLRDEIILE